MNLRDYFFGQRVELRSALTPDELRKRINSSMPSVFKRSNEPRVRGSYFLGRLRLHWSTTSSSNNLAPAFVASLKEVSGGSTIEGDWGATRFTRIWFGLWFLLSSAMFVIATLGIVGILPREPVDWAFFFVVPIFTSVPVIMVHYTIKSADERLRLILEFLAKEVGATPV